MAGRVLLQRMRARCRPPTCTPTSSSLTPPRSALADGAGPFEERAAAAAAAAAGAGCRCQSTATATGAAAAAAAGGGGGGKPRSKPLSFSFSGAGFLAPFHLGVVKTLLDKGLINDRTKLAGASAGSLVAASTVLGLSAEEQLEAYMKMAHACRASGFVGRVYPVLAQSLRERFPDDAHEICNGRLTVALMRLWPNPQLAPILVDRFSSKDDLVDALVTSSHVPLYLDATQPLWRRFRGGFYADGGLVDLVPPLPDAIKVCVFPPSFLLRSDLHVHPHLLNPVADTTPPGKAKGVVKGGFPFSLAQLMRWAFVAPQEDADIERLYALGQEAAWEWVATGGVQEGREIDVVETQALEDDTGRRVVPSNAAAMAAAAAAGPETEDRGKQRPGQSGSAEGG